MSRSETRQKKNGVIHFAMVHPMSSRLENTLPLNPVQRQVQKCLSSLVAEGDVGSQALRGCV